ncbi:MAG: serine protease [Ruminococcaceae bacterium]|nr:serine protease [Oscillospiraceae bacterium]
MSVKTCLACGGTCKEDAKGAFRCVYCGSCFDKTDFEPAKDLPSVQAPAIKATSSEDIYADNKDGVVEIRTDTGAASGFVISKNGLVLTNAHAVLDPSEKISKNIFVKLGDHFIRAHVIAIGNTDGDDADSADLALLATEDMPRGAVNLTLGQSSTVRIGQHVYYIGNSKGEGLCMTGGIVSDNYRKVEERYYIMTDAATNPGNSGGPLFNEEGKVIGVHVSARNEAVGMKYAIPIDTACAFLHTVEDQLKLPHDSLADDVVRESSRTEALAIANTVIAGANLVYDFIELIERVVKGVYAKLTNRTKA